MFTKASTLLFALLLSASLAWGQSFVGKVTLETSWRTNRTMTLLLDGARSLLLMEDNGQTRQVLYTDYADNSHYLLHAEQQPPRAVRNTHQGLEARQNGLSFSNIQVQPQTQMIGDYLCQRVSFSIGGGDGEAWVAADLASLELEKHLSAASGDMGQFLLVPGVPGVALQWSLPALAGKPAQTATVQVEELSSLPVPVALPANTRVLDMATINNLLLSAQGDPAQEAAAQAQIEALKAAFYQN